MADVSHGRSGWRAGWGWSSTLAAMADRATGPSRRGLILRYVEGHYVVGTVVCLLLFWGPIVAFAAFSSHQTRQDEPGIRAATEAYLTALIDGDAGTAYDLLCEADRREQPRATWLPISNDGNPPTGFRIISAGTPSGGGQLQVIVELTHERVPSTEVRFSFQRGQKEDGAWKVCGVTAL